MRYRMEAAGSICFDIVADDEARALALAKEAVDVAWGTDNELSTLDHGRAYFNHDCVPTVADVDE